MIPAAEIGADLLEGQAGQLAGNVHTDLPRHEHIPMPAGGLQLSRIDGKVSADAFGDALDGGLARNRIVAKVLFDDRFVEWLLSRPGERFELGQCSLESSAAAR